MPIEAIVATLVFAYLAGAWYWNESIRCIPLFKFGGGTVHRILSCESLELRKEIYARGWMTNREWDSIVRSQTSSIEAELKRRGNGLANPLLVVGKPINETTV